MGDVSEGGVDGKNKEDAYIVNIPIKQNSIIDLNMIIISSTN